MEQTKEYTDAVVLVSRPSSIKHDRQRPIIDIILFIMNSKDWFIQTISVLGDTPGFIN
jgi:hypothetical protein